MSSLKHFNKILIVSVIVGGAIFFQDGLVHVFKLSVNKFEEVSSSLGAAANGFAVLQPEAPRITVDTSMPRTNRTVRVNPTDCNNPNNGLQALLNKAQGGDEIVIPAGMECLGQYVFPARSSGDNDWIVVRTETSDSQLKPGQRVTPSDSKKLAKITTNSLNLWRTDTPDNGSPSHQGKGSLYYPWRVNQPNWGVGVNPLGLWRFLGNAAADSEPYTEWREEPYTEGTVVPATCRAGEWFRKTDVPQVTNPEHIYLCVENNRFVNVSATKTSPALTFENGAHHYRVIGLEVTQIPAPNPPHPLLSTEITPRQSGSLLSALISIKDTAHNIVIDRSYIHGAGYPARVMTGIGNNGEHIGIIDSYLSDLSVWTGPQYDQNTISIGIDLSRNSEGPVKIKNNYIEAIGINVFVSSGNTSDVELVGNHITKSTKYMPGSPDSNGHLYNNRHLLEFKGGKRWLVEGNIFENNWSVVNQGAAVLFQFPLNAKPITDINFKNNVIRNVPQAFVMLNAKNNSTTGKINIENNLIYDIEGKKWQPNHAWIGGTGQSGIFMYVNGGVEDISIRNNTVYNRSGVWPYLIITTPNSANRFIVEDNIFDFNIKNPILTQATGAWLYGNDALKSAFNNSYSFNNNALINPIGVEVSKYPENNIWLDSVTEVGFVDFGKDNFQLKQNSILKGKSSEGKDVGVDWNIISDVLDSVPSGSSVVEEYHPQGPKKILPDPADKGASGQDGVSGNNGGSVGAANSSNPTPSSGGGGAVVTVKQPVVNSTTSGGGSGGGSRSSGSNSSAVRTNPVMDVSGQSSSSAVSEKIILERNLAVGSRGQDVVQLQAFLIRNNYLEIGNDTGFFGPLTESAVRRFQSDQGIVSSGTAYSTGYGAVGPLTRSVLRQDVVGGVQQNVTIPKILSEEETRVLKEALEQQIYLLQIILVKLLEGSF